jgi:SAM-dependent methyltransferase
MGMKRISRRLWGTADLDVRQKWTALWRHLRHVTGNAAVLDAGCGDGAWSLELAGRRPHWTVTGIDRDHCRIAKADATRRRLGFTNVSFAVADFQTFRCATNFDVVLSVASAHYLAEAGLGAELFHNFATWLNPGGRLILFGPRTHDEAPYWSRCAPPTRHTVFGSRQLAELTENAGLNLDLLKPVTGRAGALAKQISAFSGRHGFLRLGCYPIEIALDVCDCLTAPDDKGSCSWVVIATKPLLG